jgi:hypothetical protein
MTIATNQCAYQRLNFNQNSDNLIPHKQQNFWNYQSLLVAINFNSIKSKLVSRKN